MYISTVPFHDFSQSKHSTWLFKYTIRRCVRSIFAWDMMQCVANGNAIHQTMNIRRDFSFILLLVDSKWTSRASARSRKNEMKMMKIENDFSVSVCVCVSLVACVGSTIWIHCTFLQALEERKAISNEFLCTHVFTCVHESNRFSLRFCSMWRAYVCLNIENEYGFRAISIRSNQYSDWVLTISTSAYTIKWCFSFYFFQFILSLSFFRRLQYCLSFAIVDSPFSLCSLRSTFILIVVVVNIIKRIFFFIFHHEHARVFYWRFSLLKPNSISFYTFASSHFSFSSFSHVNQTFCQQIKFSFYCFQLQI